MGRERGVLDVTVKKRVASEGGAELVAVIPFCELKIVNCAKACLSRETCARRKNVKL